MSKEKTRSKNLPLFVTAGVLACSAVLAMIFMAGDSGAEQLSEELTEQTTKEAYEQTVEYLNNISINQMEDTEISADKPDNEEYSVSDVFTEEDFEIIDFVGGVCCDNIFDDDVIDDE